MIAVDTSTLSAVARCGTEAGLRYALGWTAFEDNAPMRAGSAAHEALAAWFRGESGVLDLNDYEVWASETVATGDRLHPTNVRRILARWFEINPPSALPFVVPSPDLVEVGFSVPLDDAGEVQFVGRMDALGHGHQGEWYVIEHKTTGRMDETFRRRIRSSAQVSGYTYAAQVHLKRPVVGVMVNAIELADLPDDPKRKCRTHGVVFAECGALHARAECFIVQRTPEQLDQWRHEALRLARVYERLRRIVPTLDHLLAADTRGQFAGHCVQCQFRTFCDLGRPIDIAPNMLRHEPWEPFAHAFGA